MPENFQFVTGGKAIELQHDRRIKRSDVAMPDIVGHTGEKDVRVTALKRSRHRHLRNRMALPKIFTQKKRVDSGGVAAHDDVLVVVGKNLPLNEVTRAE